MQDIERTVKEYLLEEFLPGAGPEELTESTPLIITGILDSLATIQLTAILVEHFGIEIAAHEASVDHLDTVGDIASLVRSKM
ncbi:MAG: acyl carrier protein [Gemmatimonadaceae bacterium]